MTSNKPISDATLKQYQYSLKKLDINNLNVIDFEKTIEIIEGKNKNIGTQKVYLSAILWYMTSNKIIDAPVDKYRQRIYNIRKEIELKTEKNKLTGKQKDNYIEWDELKKIKDQLGSDLEESNYKDSSKHKLYIILSLYMDLPPRRREDYSKMRFYKRKPLNLNNKDNYLIINKKAGYIIFNIYKTSNHYGQQKIALPTKLLNKLKTYVSTENIEMGSYLFKSESSETFGNFLNYQMKKITNKNISPNIFRHSYVSSLNENKLNMTKRKQISKKMAHSVGQQLLYKKI